MKQTVFLKPSSPDCAQGNASRARVRCRIDEFLWRALLAELEKAFGEKRALSNSKIRRLIFSGNVFVNNMPVRNPAFILHNNQSVRVVCDTEKLFFEKETFDADFALDKNSIIFEDEFLLAVNKPAFLPVDETFVKSRPCLCRIVAEYLNSYCGIVHRLDSGTSGIILFSKRKEVNAALHKAFDPSAGGERAKKIYLAVCVPAAARQNEFDGLSEGAEFSVQSCIARVSPKSKPAKFGEAPSERGGKFSRTDFRVLKKSVRGVLFECALFTGRTHQIRVHLASRALPILGDTLYGGEAAERIYLHSTFA